jgi:hypothetical protein
VTLTKQTEAILFRRIARRVESILEEARVREERGQMLALDIDARFRLEELGAVQFQVASAILEETGGIRQEEVVGELLSLGMAALLNGAAKATGPEPFGSLATPALPGEEPWPCMPLSLPIDECERVLN